MGKRDRDRRQGSHRRLATLACATAAALLAAPSAAQAVDFRVTGTGDAGSCTGTSCPSLRAAIDAVNSIAPGTSDRILFQSGLSGTITLGSPLPPVDVDISFPLEIVGPGASTLAVSGAGSHRIFEIESTSGPVTISGLTLRDGNASAGGTDNFGGAILNQGQLTVRASVVSGNRTDDFGGGIGNQGELTVLDSIVSGNRADDWGGGVYAQAGGSTTVQASTISGNSAVRGGGIYGDNATLTIRRSTISGNHATVTAGGGAFAAGGSPLTIEASTITANRAQGDAGGVRISSTSNTTLTSTIVAGNSAGGAGPDLRGLSDTEGEFRSSFSLIGNTSGANVVNLGGSIFNLPARLGPLQGNGGPTPTHTPALSSPAIDAGRAAGPDQRGFARPVNLPGIADAPGSNAADIGAVELPVPSNAFRFGKLKSKKRKGIAILFVHVPGPGVIGLRGKGIKSIGLSGARASRIVSGGRVKLRIKAGKGKAAKKLRKRLRKKGKAKRRVRVTYVPSGGGPNTQSRKVKLVKKRR